MASNKNKKARKLPRDLEYLESIRNKTFLRAATFADKKKAADKRRARERVDLHKTEG